MNQIDSLKLQLVLQDCTKRLQFLGHINIQDEASSELAGFEISKLLNSQRQLETQYAELIQTRSTLTGISNKPQLEEIQAKIQEVAKKLKESTKKLCRLFKENPDIVADKKKIESDRRALIYNIEQLYSAIQQNQYQELQEKIIKELSDQDLIRKLTSEEKNLNSTIKELKLQKAQEQKDYQLECTEKQKLIQMLKDKLVYKTKKADQKINYEEKECLAEEGTCKTKLEYKIRELESNLGRLKGNIQKETLVNAQLIAYLNDKEQQLLKQSEDLGRNYDKMKNDIDFERDTLIKKSDEDKEKLQQLRARQKQEDLELIENDKKEQEKNEALIQKQLKQIKLNNAIQYVQMKYLEWKEAGGGKKKKKKGKKKGKKK